MNQTPILNFTETGLIRRVSSLLQAGGVIAIPTDTVYGIGCLVSNIEAISRLYEIKKREHTKAIPVLIGEKSQLENIVTNLGPNCKLLTEVFWPGALTLVLKKHSGLPKPLSMYSTIGVRMPDHNWLRGLLIKMGPFAVTSANISGQEPAQTAKQVAQQLDGRIDLIIDGGPCMGGVSSTVVDCTSEKSKILRKGAISLQRILEALGEDKK